MVNKEATEALKWITNILNNAEVPYQIEGGLAAICYGSTRELADIDIFIPNFGFEKISEAVNKFNQYGPDYHIGTNWKLAYQILDYNGQQIEICDADNAEYLDTALNIWIKRDINFNQAETVTKFGIKMKVIPRLDLIEYKKRLGRDVDIIDIEQIDKTVSKNHNIR